MRCKRTMFLGFRHYVCKGPKRLQVLVFLYKLIYYLKCISSLLMSYSEMGMQSRGSVSLMRTDGQISYCLLTVLKEVPLPRTRISHILHVSPSPTI